MDYARVNRSIVISHRMSERSAYRSAFSDIARGLQQIPEDQPVLAMFTG